MCEVMPSSVLVSSLMLTLLFVLFHIRLLRQNYYSSRLLRQLASRDAKIEELERKNANLEKENEQLEKKNEELNDRWVKRVMSGLIKVFDGAHDLGEYASLRANDDDYQEFLKLGLVGASACYGDELPVADIIKREAKELFSTTTTASDDDDEEE